MKQAQGGSCAGDISLDSSSASLSSTTTIMTYLTPHLTFASPGSSSSRSPLPPPGTTLLVSDTLASPADFVLLHFVAVQLKAGRAVILVGLAESLAHWKALARKIVSYRLALLG